MRGALSAIVALGLGIALLLLTAIAVSSYYNIRKSQDSERSVSHTHAVIAAVESLLSDIKDAETGQRGFLLTGDESYLEPFTAALSGIPFQLRNLREINSDNPAQQRRIDRIGELVRQELEFLGASIKAKRTATLSDNATLAEFGMGKRTMDGIRSIGEDMQIEERSLLAARSRESATSASHAMAVIFLGNAAGFAILAGAFWALRREVRQRERAEHSARELAAEFEDLYNNSPCGYHSVADDGTIIRMNNTELEWFGYSREEVVGKMRHPDLMTSESARYFQQQAFPLFKRQGWLKDVEFNYLRKDGSVLPASLNATAIYDDNGAYVMSRSTIFDITSRKEAAHKRKQDNAFLDSVIENIPNMLFIKDAVDLKFIRINKAGQRLLGYTQQEVAGKSDFDFFAEEEARRFTAKDREVIDGGVLADIAEETIHTRGGETRILHTQKIPVNDGSGKPLYLLGISEDVTERKRAQEQIIKLNADLEQHAFQLEVANKELESFSYSVSHDLRTPLRAVDGYSQMLSEDYADKFDDEGRRLLGIIRASSQKMSALIDDLLAFSRLGRKPVTAAAVDMRALLAEIVSSVEPAAGQKKPLIEVAPMPDVNCDRALIAQVWMNLLTNAVKFTRDKPAPRIEVGVQHQADKFTFWVKDNGAGFDMQYYRKLFGVFQRLHSDDEFPGTGVGLAIVQRIVTRHGGQVWAEGKIDEGAAFFFTLPRGELDGGTNAGGDIAGRGQQDGRRTDVACAE
ncbi:MAG: sensor hybrid histidine kinase [Betaproteobacteria bacterium]|nr:sensor hybrid histidine kinase [Betaproteobacteria bacterium]